MPRNIFLFSLLLLFSCTDNKVEEKATASATQGATPVQVIVLANLPDSLQPRIFNLDTMPAPKVFHAGKGEFKPLAILRNEYGETILDSEGNTIILGEGGKANFTNFTSDNGLAMDAVSCSVMDNFGNLWFGTNGGGVSKYDGKSFTTYENGQGLVNTNVTCITVDRSGNIWIGTLGGGVSKYDGKTFTNYTTAQGLANNSVKSILEDKSGNLWFCTNRGVSKYDGKSFTNITTAQGLVSNVVLSIAEDKSGNLWFGTNRGLSQFDGNSFISFTTAQGLAHNTVWCLAPDKSGNLWIGTRGGGVSKYDGKSITNYTTAQGLAHNAILVIAEDKSGNLWFGTEGGGVSTYNGKYFTTYTTGQGLADNVVRSITEDRSGNLWFGTLTGGLSKYDGKTFTVFTPDYGLSHETVFSITEDKSGNLWFGTNEGVSKYDGRSFTNYTTAQGLADHAVWSTMEDKSGNLWFGTDGGVLKYDGKSFTSYTSAQGLAGNNIWSIIEDRSGNIWFGSSGAGVSKFDGKTFTTYSTDQGLATNYVFSIIEDRSGNLWFATYGGGVSKYDGTSFTTYTTAHGLSSNNVWSIIEDRSGNIWIVTEMGISFLSKELNDWLSLKSRPVKSKTNISEKIFESFTVEDGLPSNNVTNLLALPDGRIVIGSILGITLLTISEDFTKITDIKNYDSNTGYPLKEVNVGQNGLFLDSRGIIWVGTGSKKTGLVRFDYSALRKNVELPNVIIQDVKVKDENICWYDLQSQGILRNQQDSLTAMLQEFEAYGKSLSPNEKLSILKRFGNIQFDGITKYYPLPENLVLPYEHNQIEFEFTAIETDRPFLVKYQYKLEGYDKNWSPVTEKSNANFGNIHEGSYIFKLKAQGANGVWSEPITYAFKVLPPWYRTWWSYALYALIFLAAITTFIKWRERSLQMEKEKLEYTVQVRTAEAVTEKKKSDDLLLNILPEEVAEELKAKGRADAKQFDEVTVMFTDFKGFTRISEKLSPSELVNEIHTCFKAFDNIISKYNIEKIKTIGDSYMCAGGLPVANVTNAKDVVYAAIEIQKFMREYLEQRQKEGKESFEIRIGVHTGPVVAGIVGVKKFAYDIWGDTVNIASRMETSGEAGKVNISSSTYELVRDAFNCIHRGKIQAKNKGYIDMYFVEGII